MGSNKNLAELVETKLYALRYQKQAQGACVDYLTDVSIQGFYWNMLWFYERHMLPINDKFLFRRFHHFLSSLTANFSVPRYGLEKELVLGRNNNPLTPKEANYYVKQCNAFSSKTLFTLDGSVTLGVIEYKNADTYYHTSFASAFEDLLQGEKMLFAFLPPSIQPLPQNKQKRWASDLHIHYGFPTFEQRLEKLLAVRDILPELVIMTAENSSFFSRSYRIKKRFDDWIIYQKPQTLFHYFSLMHKSMDFQHYNLLRLSLFGSLEIRVFDALPRLEDQREILFAINEIILSVTPPPSDDPSLPKRWKYALGKGTHYAKKFPERKYFWEELFHTLSHVPEQLPERLAL